MGTRLFNRSVRLAFDNTPGALSDIASAVKGLSFVQGVTDLFMKFHVERTSEEAPNTAKIEVYNLAVSSRSALKKDVVIQLEAGYGLPPGADPQNPLGSIARKVIFKGNISRISTEKQGPDLVTKIEAGDGLLAYQNASINVSMVGGASGATLIPQLAAELAKHGVSLGNIQGLITATFQNGIVMSGSVREKLNQLTKQMGLEWSIQNQKLEITTPAIPVNPIAVLLQTDTGLLDKPVVREEGGIEFRSLLNGDIRPGALVFIDGGEVKGLYKCRKCVYSGDNRRGEFEVNAEAEALGTGI